MKTAIPSINLSKYQREISDKAKKLLDTHKKVGLDLFTRGGKSYIAMDLVEHLVEKHGCNQIAVIAPKCAADNLRANQFRSFKYKDKITFVNKELLSRHVNLQEYLENNDCDSPDVIIFDEAHTMFGTNIHNQLTSESEFINSKFIIAMTATEYNNLTGINSLSLLVGKQNVIHFTLSDGIREGIINPVKYIPSIMNWDASCFTYLANLKNLYNIKSNSYLFNLIDELEEKIGRHSDNLEDEIVNHIKNKVNIDSSSGGRVFVFFNTINDVINHEVVITNIIKRLYDYWGNKPVKVNYFTYVSGNSKEDDEDILRVIGDKSKPDTIDVIATVNRGAMSIHPSDVHFGMIMCSTKSIQRYMQSIGRLINLKGYDANDTVIFDFKNNRTFVGHTSINVGRDKLRDRNKYKRKEALNKFTNESYNLTENPLISCQPCTEMEETLEFIARIENLTKLNEGNEELLDVLQGLIKTINKRHNGNVYKALNKLIKYRKLQGKTSDVERLKGLKSRYDMVRKALMFDGFTPEDEKEILSKFDFLGASIYINESDSIQQGDYVKRLYSDIEKLKEGKINVKEFIKKYSYDYLTDKMTSSCYSLIQRDNSITVSLLNNIENVLADEVNKKPVERFGYTQEQLAKFEAEEINKEAAELALLLFKKLKRISKIKDHNNELRYKAWLEIQILCMYLRTIHVNEVTNSCLDNTLRYINENYFNEMNLYDDIDNSLLKHIQEIIDILIMSKTGTLATNSKNYDRTIAFISRAGRLSNLEETRQGLIYSIALRLFGINTVKEFDDQITHKSYMWNLAVNAIENKDRAKIEQVTSVVRIDDMPRQLKAMINKSGINKVNTADYTDKDLKIAVQSLWSGNTTHARFLKAIANKDRSVRNKIIENAFSSRISSKEKENVLKFLETGACNEKLIVSAMDKHSYTLKILVRLKSEGIFKTKEYTNKVTELIEIYNKA